MWEERNGDPSRQGSEPRVGVVRDLQGIPKATAMHQGDVAFKGNEPEGFEGYEGVPWQGEAPSSGWSPEN